MSKNTIPALKRRVAVKSSAACLPGLPARSVCLSMRNSADKVQMTAPRSCS